MVVLGYIETVTGRRILKNVEGGYQYNKKLRKNVSWNRLQWLEILLTFAGLADVSFHYDSFPL